MRDSERQIQKFLTDGTHITVEDCDRLLTAYGYELKKHGGSHRTYHRKYAHPITIVAPKGTKYVKSVYVDLIMKYLKPEA